MVFKKFSRKRFLYVDCGYFFAALGACEQILGIRCMGYFIAVRFGFDKVAVFVHQPSLGYVRGAMNVVLPHLGQGPILRAIGQASLFQKILSPRNAAISFTKANGNF